MSRAPTADRRRGANACPVCAKPADATAHAPFCSQGCRDRDLLHWLGDSYRVPGPPAGLDSEA
ncbi:MAG TPA: DNA gyrase inhibitor YacG [Allosphingosinicella sp.]|nr:DNA gyrase inhibitor YacG [Allosphingosinicella sp.]